MKFKIDDKLIDGRREAPNWIKNGLTPDAIKYSDAFGEWLAGKGEGRNRLGNRDKLTTTQFRNIFSEVIRIKMQAFENNEESFLLLKPRMAYQMARDNKKGGRTLKDVMQPAMEAVVDIDSNDADTTKTKQERFNRFANFFESILAFHRAYGGN